MNVADAADEVKKILNGKEEISGSLKDMKVRRIELFLRDKLGVEEFKFDPRAGEQFLLGLIEGNVPSSRFEDVTEEVPKQSLTPDLLGFYTITIPYTEETIESLSTMLEEDVSWFEPTLTSLGPRSLSTRTRTPSSDASLPASASSSLSWPCSALIPGTPCGPCSTGHTGLS